MVTTGEKTSDDVAADPGAADNNEDDSKQALLKGEVNGQGDDASGSDHCGEAIELAEVARVPDVQVVGSAGDGCKGDVEAGGGDSVAKKPAVAASSPCAEVCSPAPLSGGLTKEELEAFAKDPFWRRLRLILFLLFWAIWLAMFVAVIVIIVVSPKCPPRQARQFWQKPFYRVQVRSFAPDPSAPASPSRAGSLAGLQDRLPYLRQTLGIHNFLLSSLVKAEPGSGCPKDFAAFNADLGTLDQLKALTKLGRKKGFNLMMEMDLSQADPAWPEAKDDGFVRDPTDFPRVLSRDGKPAWSGGLLHLPRAACNSVNVSSERVRRALFNAMSAWLEAGLSGFLLNNVAFLGAKKSNLVEDLPSASSFTDWNGRNPFKFLFSKEAADFVAAARAFLDAEAAARGREVALFADFGDLGLHRVMTDRVMPDWLALFAGPGAGPHALVFAGLGTPLHAAASPTGDLREAAQWALDRAPNLALAWATNGPHLRRDPSPALAVLGLTLPGVPVLYYGQELGMGHVTGFRLDPPASYLTTVSRDEDADAAQSPMQWAGVPENAGWLPPPVANGTAPQAPVEVLNWTRGLDSRREDILSNNARRLMSSGHPESVLQLTQALVRLAGRLESLQWGDAAFLAAAHPDLVAFTRKAVRFPAVLVLVNNAGNRSFTLDVPKAMGAAGMTLELLHSWGGGSGGGHSVGKRYDSDGGVFVPERTALVFVASEA